MKTGPPTLSCQLLYFTVSPKCLGISLTLYYCDLIYCFVLCTDNYLTVKTVVGAADGGDGVAAAHDELVVLTLVVHRLRLGQHQPLEVQPE